MGLPVWGDIQVQGFIRKHCRDPFGDGIEPIPPVVEDVSAPPESGSCVGESGKWQIG